MTEQPHVPVLPHTRRILGRRLVRGPVDAVTLRRRFGYELRLECGHTVQRILQTTAERRAAAAALTATCEWCAAEGRPE